MNIDRGLNATPSLIGDIVAVAFCTTVGAIVGAVAV